MSEVVKTAIEASTNVVRLLDRYETKHKPIPTEDCFYLIEEWSNLERGLSSLLKIYFKTGKINRMEYKRRQKELSAHFNRVRVLIKEHQKTYQAKSLYSKT